MLNELSEWMESRGYASIDDFKGKMAREVSVTNIVP
jgi:dihydroorotate dehydrogenase